jgi:hypothetical protein
MAQVAELDLFPALAAVPRSRPSLQHAPAKRYASASALAEDLRRFQAGEPIRKSPGHAEQLQLADLCLRYKQRCAAAVRFYESAFEKDSVLAEDTDQGHRARAARAAVLAGAGQGKDAGGLTEKERTALRLKGLSWLQADLRLHAAAIQARQPRPEGVKRLLAALERLALWGGEPDLAEVRDPGRLAILPREEQKTWKGLWKEVDEQLLKAGQRFTTSESKGVLGPKQRENVLSVKMRAGRIYVIDLESDQFDSYLRLEKAPGKTLAENDDVSPHNPNSRLIFQAPADDTYRVITTSFQQQGKGSYTLRIRELKDDP